MKIGEIDSAGNMEAKLVAASRIEESDHVSGLIECHAFSFSAKFDNIS
jgi:hypothetical protein